MLSCLGYKIVEGVRLVQMTDRMSAYVSAYVLIHCDYDPLLTNLRAKKIDFFNDFKDLTSFLRVLILRGSLSHKKTLSIYINIYI